MAVWCPSTHRRTLVDLTPKCLSLVATLELYYSRAVPLLLSAAAHVATCARGSFIAADVATCARGSFIAAVAACASGSFIAAEVAAHGSIAAVAACARGSSIAAVAACASGLSFAAFAACAGGSYIAIFARTRLLHRRRLHVRHLYHRCRCPRAQLVHHYRCCCNCSMAPPRASSLATRPWRALRSPSPPLHLR